LKDRHASTTRSNKSDAQLETGGAAEFPAWLPSETAKSSFQRFSATVNLQTKPPPIRHLTKPHSPAPFASLTARSPVRWGNILDFKASTCFTP